MTEDLWLELLPMGKEQMEPGESLIVTPGAVLGFFYIQRYRFLTITQLARVTGLSYHHTANLLRGFEARGHESTAPCSIWPSINHTTQIRSKTLQ